MKYLTYSILVMFLLASAPIFGQQSETTAAAGPIAGPVVTEKTATAGPIAGPVVTEKTKKATATTMYDSSTRIDSVLVSVNGTAITLLDVILETERSEKALVGVYTGERLYAETRNIRKTALENIITRKLLYAKYRENPFKIENQDIENFIDSMVKDSGAISRAAFEKAMEAIGYPPERLREYAKERIAVEGLMYFYCDRDVYVAPKEVYEEYLLHPEKWTVPERISIQLLQINTSNTASDSKKAVEDIQKLIREDSSQERFTRAVLAYSAAANAKTGGVIDDTERDKIRPEFAQALKDAKTGDIVGPIEAPEAIFFLRVVSITPAKKVPFSEIGKEIREEMTRERAEEARKKFAENLRTNAFVRYYFE